MAIQAIPNQPINISPVADDACLVVNSKTYCALYNTNDNLYLQMFNAPCTGELFCNPNFSSTGGSAITVQNAFFNTELSDWVAGSNWTWDASGGAKLTYAATGGTDQRITQDLVTLVSGASYSVSFSVRDYTSTSGLTLSVFLGSGGALQSITADGNYTFNLVCGADAIMYFTQNGGSDGSLVLDNIQVTQAVDCIPKVATGWEIGAGGMCHAAGDVDAIVIPAILNTVVVGSAYFRVQVRVENMTAGSAVVFIGLNGAGTIIQNGTFTYYDLAVNGSDLSIIPSTDFDGCITYLSAYELALDYGVEVVDLQGTTIHDAVAESDVSYVKDRVNVTISLTGLLEDGCFQIKVTDPCTSTVYLSNCFVVKESHPCTKLIAASGDNNTTSLGFLWSNFQLSHRMRFLKFNPEYPYASDDYEPSDGSRINVYSKREKYYTGLLDKVDENTHDTITAQMQCSSFAIDGVSYFVKLQNYKPEWNKDGINNLSRARIELRKTTGTIYSK